jgi:hypothetical protein
MCAVAAVETTPRITVDCRDAPMLIIGASNEKRLFAAWVLAALLIAPASEATDIVAFRAVNGLPRAGFGDGQASVWRNVGIVAESELLDAEVKIMSCVPTPSVSRTSSDPSGSACATSDGETANGNLGQQFAVTFKVPRWSEGAPLVDLSLRSWRGSSRVGTPEARRDGSVAELVATQPLGSVDTFVGYSTPVALGNAASGWRSTFAGVTWYVTQGTRVEFVADRGQSVSTAAIDRTLTLRIVHATTARNARFAAWTTRALDDRVDTWQVGAGLEIAF